MNYRLSWLLLLLGMILGTPAWGHEIRPVSLELREVTANRFAVRLKVPAVENRFLGVRPVFSPSCRITGNAVPQLYGASAVARYQILCPTGLAGTRIAFENLDRTEIDAMVTIDWLNGQVVTRRLRPIEPVMTVPAKTGAADVLRDYVGLGVEHILLGPDHLLFVLSLILLMGAWQRLLVTATAFTLAHSLTLSLATLGLVHVPMPPLEALIALSILYMAIELSLRARAPDRPPARPWLLAFAFGLLHGLGFASALAEIGLPNHEIPIALFGFNVGVELGQIAFILVVLAVLALVRRVASSLDRVIYWIATYAIGGMASFWVIERISAFRAG